MAQTQNSDEKKLLLLLSEGDAAAFTVLFHRYQGKVYSTAIRYLKGKEHSEEIVQDIFLQVWNRRKEMSEIIRFESFLFIIARNRIFDALKKTAKEISYVNSLVLEIEQSNTSEDSLLEKQFGGILADVLQELPTQQKKIYNLSRVQGFSYQEIGTQLDISPLTVKKHMSQCLKFIRMHMQHHLEISIFMFFYVFFR